MSQKVNVYVYSSTCEAGVHGYAKLVMISVILHLHNFIHICTYTYAYYIIKCDSQDCLSCTCSPLSLRHQF